MAHLSQLVAAELAGLTARRLQQMAHDDDGPPKDETGYPAREFGEWLKRRTLASVGVGNDGVAYVYEAERARLTHEQADKTALENAELRGDLVRSSLVGPHWTEMVASMRARLVSMPSRIASLIADVIARAKVQAQAEAMVYEALAEIEKDGLPVAARERIARAARNACAQSGPAAAETDDEPVGERTLDALGGGRERTW